MKIEGFRLDRLLTECIAAKLRLRNIKIKNDMEMTLTASSEEYKRLIKIAGSKYRITVLRERGAVPFLERMRARKISLFGVMIFSFLLYYQSLFVSEIRIYGYESVPETQIRQVLRDAGLYEGCKKNIEPEDVKQVVYDRLEKIIWLGIHAKGGMVEIDIVEGSIKPPAIADNMPCHIVSANSGYIAEIIPRKGIRTVEDNTYVTAGDILITGIVPVNDTTYSADAKGEMYVHATGEVKARVPYYVTFYQERYERSLIKTGKFRYGIEIIAAGRKLNTLNLHNRYEVSKRNRRDILNLVKPVPLKITWLKDEEVKISERVRSAEEINKRTEKQLRAYKKENLSKDAQILNKSLKFSAGKNIIEVSVMFDVLQEIGEEREILFGEF